MPSTIPEITDRDYGKPRTIVLIPSITLGQFSAQFLHGLRYYEERYLYFLTFLKQPQTHLLAVLTEGVEPALIEYFINHAAYSTGLPKQEIQKRFACIWIKSKTGKTLTQRILRDPKTIRKIKSALPRGIPAYIEFWRVTQDEIRLAKTLKLPYFGLKLSALKINTKSGARNLFKACGIPIPLGFENCSSLQQIYIALHKLSRMSSAKSFLIKMNDEGGGIGIIRVDRQLIQRPLAEFEKQLPLPSDQPMRLFLKYLKKEKSVVEEFIEAPISVSPSVQFEITAHGKIRPLATHLQIIDGTDYLGTKFPAPASFRKQIVRVGLRATRAIRSVGGRGFVAMDLLVTRRHDRWRIYGIEINARKGGANHTHMWAKYLTGATYDAKQGILQSPTGEIFYQASEYFINKPWLKQIPAKKLLQTILDAKLDFNHKTGAGVFVHLLSPLRYFGKFGVTVIGHSEKEVQRYWNALTRLIESLQP